MWGHACVDRGGGAWSYQGLSRDNSRRRTPRARPDVGTRRRPMARAARITRHYAHRRVMLVMRRGGDGGKEERRKLDRGYGGQLRSRVNLGEPGASPGEPNPLEAPSKLERELAIYSYSIVDSSISRALRVCRYSYWYIAIFRTLFVISRNSPQGSSMKSGMSAVKFGVPTPVTGSHPSVLQRAPH